MAKLSSGAFTTEYPRLIKTRYGGMFFNSLGKVNPSKQHVILDSDSNTLLPTQRQAIQTPVFDYGKNAWLIAAWPKVYFESCPDRTGAQAIEKTVCRVIWHRHGR
jgi:hypothetical protein